MSETVLDQARRAKAAARGLATLSTEIKNAALLAIADGLLSQSATIEDANCANLAAGRERGLSAALLDRLMLNPTRIEAMAEGLRQIAALPDPVGQAIDGSRRPNGL